MAVPDTRDEPDAPDPIPESVAALRSRPDRTVFTEEGNSDAWIATDLTVEIVR